LLLAPPLLGLAVGVACPGEPRIVRENTEWLDVWVPNANANDLP